MSDTAKLDERTYHLLFAVRRSCLYHNHRRRFYDWLNKTQAFVSALFGAATIGALFAQFDPRVPALAAAVSTVLATINLFVGPAQRAREHHDLARRFGSIEQKMAHGRSLTDKEAEALVRERLEIEKDEPPKRRNLDTLCHNELLRSLGGNDDQMWGVGPIQRVLADIIDWRPHAVRRPRSQTDSEPGDAPVSISPEHAPAADAGT
ncbi:hypothetical protein [Dongia sedimenti]|uniref:SMODS and SLOG-associating 2TM effector domain-containing protein n=1 Tax=Dongia sedimenti TaxID=3064282 RepID=A0ABU0YUX6_9PROT|nr:hypothetical protein [Rhodospirillaceae bacterium R-7]